MSTPMTRPVSPTALLAMNTSIPAPHPRSRTTSPSFRPARAVGFPQPRPRLEVAGTEPSVAASYPNASAWACGSTVDNEPEPAATAVYPSRTRSRTSAGVVVGVDDGCAGKAAPRLLSPKESLGRLVRDYA